MIRRAGHWIESRTGLGTLTHTLLYEAIPGSSGWAQVFGSIVLFLFLLQIITGILLSFNYAPVPGDAYNSVKYITQQVPGGGFIRGLHHWGASLMIVAVALHMVQTFLYGAYKKPREVTWIVGVLLLLLTLAFGLTGYLLPWDNRAYWGTVVTTQIASKVPLLGQYSGRLLGTSGSIGVVTFARFFAAHVLVLPLVTAVLVAFHVYLVRKHGVTPDPGDTGPVAEFFPVQASKDGFAILFAFAVLVAMAALVTAPLDRIADPTDVNTVPRPDWYFLFVFQALKLFKGPLELAGAVILPGLMALALLLIPFLDRGVPIRLRHRTGALAALAVALSGWTALTATAIVTTPRQGATASRLPGVSDWRYLSPEELAGIGYFRQEQCSVCHNLVEGPQKAGPNLATVGERKSASWMIAHFRNPPRLIPGSNMPPIQLNDAQLNTLAAFLLKLNPANAKTLEAAPTFATEGAQMYQANGCGNCHMVNGVGMKIGPSLNGVSGRHSKEWVEKHFADPAALSPGSVMPPFKFAPREMEQIVAYLFSLPPG